MHKQPNVKNCTPQDNGKASTFAFQPWLTVRDAIPISDVIRCSLHRSTFCFYLLRLKILKGGYTVWNRRLWQLMVIYVYFLDFFNWSLRYSLFSSRNTAFTSCVILNEWLCPFNSTFLNIPRSSVLTALGCCMLKLLPSRCKFCVYHSTMHQFTVSLYSKPHA